MLDIGANDGHGLAWLARPSFLARAIDPLRGSCRHVEKGRAIGATLDRFGPCPEAACVAVGAKPASPARALKTLGRVAEPFAAIVARVGERDFRDRGAAQCEVDGRLVRRPKGH